MIGSILKDPLILVEGLAQGVSDALDSEGVFYSVGYVGGFILGAKGLDKVSKVTKGILTRTKAKITVNSLDDIAEHGLKSIDEIVSKAGITSLAELKRIGVRSIDDLVALGVTCAKDLPRLGIHTMKDLTELGIKSADDLAKLGIKNADDFVEAGLGSLDDANRVFEGASGAKVISKADRTKIDNWNLTPNDELYLKYKDVYDNSKYFDQQTGNVRYPGEYGDMNKNGFTNGNYIEETLKPGTIIDRYGSNGTGKFFSPKGTPYGDRALPPFMENQPYTKYEVLIPMKIKSGEIAPWFEQLGRGKQFLSDFSVDELRDMGIIKIIE